MRPRGRFSGVHAEVEHKAPMLVCLSYGFLFAFFFRRLRSCVSATICDTGLLLHAVVPIVAVLSSPLSTIPQVSPTAALRCTDLLLLFRFAIRQMCSITKLRSLIKTNPRLGQITI